MNHTMDAAKYLAGPQPLQISREAALRKLLSHYFFDISDERLAVELERIIGFHKVSISPTGKDDHLL